MKEGFDREIDSLLRRRARGAAESRLWGDGVGDGSHAAHLDADELSAFSEGALPASARVAAASHLADCQRCRGVVVGLARVAGAGTEVEHRTAAVPASTDAAGTPAWRAFVASLFAPRVLRFAVPVLAVSLVAVVSYVALRSNGGADVQMARQNSGRSNVSTREAAAPSTAAEMSANANAAGLVGQNINATPTDAATTGAPPASHKGHGSADERPVEAVTGGANEQPSVAAAPPPPAPAPAAIMTGGPVEPSKAAPKQPAGEEAEAARADKSEERTKSARGAEQGEEVAANDAAVQRNRAAQSRANNDVQMPDGGTRNQKRGADSNISSGYGNIGGAGTAAAPKDSERERAGSRSEPLARSRPARQGEKKAGEDDDVRAGETRSAAGRRFRREGNVWVDVNYRPSMPSTGVRRGTEAFRALVADVPEVGRVAAALGGEVVVVVGGRAYRIR